MQFFAGPLKELAEYEEIQKKRYQVVSLPRKHI